MSSVRRGGLRIAHSGAQRASAVERLNVTVIRGFAWSREVQLHAAVVGTRFQRLRHEFGAVIDGDRCRQTGQREQAFENGDDALSAQ